MAENLGADAGFGSKNVCVSFFSFLGIQTVNYLFILSFIVSYGVRKPSLFSI